MSTNKVAKFITHFLFWSAVFGGATLMYNYIDFSITTLIVLDILLLCTIVILSYLNRTRK